MRKLRKRKCRVCGKEYQPQQSFQKWCSPQCGFELSQRNIEKKVKAERLEFKRKVKSNDRSALTDRTQEACNAYIRERDKHQPCISCGTRKTDIQYHAGHYKSRGSNPALRFHPDNIHKQCARCNNFQSGNITEYRINLVNKIGLPMVEWLEQDHPPQKLTLEDLTDIRDWYKHKLKLLKAKGAPF